MKKTVIFSLMSATLLFVFIGCGGEKQDMTKKAAKRDLMQKKVKEREELQIYPFKSAFVEYRLKGKNIEDGTKSVFIDKFGKSEKHLVKEARSDGSTKVEMVMIRGKNKYIIDLETNSGVSMKMKDPYEGRMTVNLKSEDFVAGGSKQSAARDLKKSAEKSGKREKIAGYECQIVRMPTADGYRELAICKGLIFRETIFRKGSKAPVRSVIARKVNLGADISEKEFELPAKAHIEEKVW